MLKDAVERWSVSDASDLYEVPRWGQGYFTINSQGHVVVHPTRETRRGIDLKQLVDRLQMRGIELPILIRFNGILHDRLKELHDVFADAIACHEYQGRYACAYPIKVNQQRQVVEQILNFGCPYGFGLEAGSKPELLAVAAMANNDIPVICNGFKDAEYIEMAMLAHKIGRQVIPVVEKYTELQLILDYAERVGVRPALGIRVKLATRGAGRWQTSAGHRSKFGLTSSETLAALQVLQQRDMSDCLKLLHFHLGSQITNIRYVKQALIEAARVYADLFKRGAGLQYLDVGGGLGVDYDGSQTNFESSMNYTLQEYANDVIYHVGSVCDDAKVPHPHIISESGRAVAAYHSVLVFGVLGVSGQGTGRVDVQAVAEDVPQPLQTLKETYESLNVRNLLESFHDAQQAMEMSMHLFSLGHLPLEQRSLAENLFWAICRRIRRLADQLEYTPEELQRLNAMLSDTYFCNFSLFQSLPDSWAVKQLFPVMPIHRLDQQPSRHAVLGDITCDSDGKIDQFINCREVRRTLLLHPFDGSAYFLGAFLIGAYQEILGDLHNLFGDTNAVHVDLNEQGEVVLETIIKGETVSEVLSYVQFKRDDLLGRWQTAVESALRQGRLSHVEAGHCLKSYEQGLSGYTYLEPQEE